MIFQYYSDTDMLYIKLTDGVSTESEEVTPGIVLDFDENNRVIGIEIEGASIFINSQKENPPIYGWDEFLLRGTRKKLANRQ